MSGAPDFFAEDPAFFNAGSSDMLNDNNFTTAEDILGAATDFTSKPRVSEIQPQYDDSMTLHEKRKAESQQNASTRNKTAKANEDASAPTSKQAVSSSGLKNKPGRKLDPNEPASKRKAQNRAAQRAFRERKEKHLLDLEEKVKELETEAAASNNENKFLRLQVERLQGELKKYRSNGSVSSREEDSAPAPSRPFTFEFPFFSEPKRAAAAAATNTTNHAYPSPQNSVSSASSKSSTGSISRFSLSRDGPSPMSSASSSSPFTNFSSSTSATPATDDKATEEDTFCDQLQLACGCPDDAIKMKKTTAAASTPAAASTISPSSVATPQTPVGLQLKKPSITTGTLNKHNDHKESVSLFSPPPLDFDFLGSYRDPLFESNDFELPELATTEYSVFDPLENPIINESFMNISEMVSKSQEKQNKSSNEDEVVPAYEKMMSCTAVWDRISTHPKFNDLDIDGLCSELRTKAKCSDTGVLLTEKDVDSVLAQL